MTQPPYGAYGTHTAAPATGYGDATMSPPRGGVDSAATTGLVPPVPPAPGPSPYPQPQQGAGVGGQPEGAQPNASRGARSRGPRRARLQLRHINPWTVLRFSCVLAIALFFVWLIVIGVLYGVLDAAGAIEQLNDSIVTIKGPGTKEPITAGIVFGSAAIIGAVNIVLFIALSTIGSVVYNLCADLVGGIEFTLSER